EWLLFTFRKLHDVVTDCSEQKTHLKSGRLDMSQQRAREWAVASGSVLSGCAIARGKCHQHVLCRLSSCEATFYSTHSNTSLHFCCERVVPTGIKNNETKTAGARDLQHGGAHVNCFPFCVSVAAQFGVDRY